MIDKTKNVTTKSISIIKLLKENNKINDSLLVCLNALSLEDLIAVKLELASGHLNNRLYGFDIWKALPVISKNAALKFALSATQSKKDAARFLGLTYFEFLNIYKKHKIELFFEHPQEPNA